MRGSRVAAVVPCADFAAGVVCCPGTNVPGSDGVNRHAAYVAAPVNDA